MAQAPRPSIEPLPCPRPLWEGRQFATRPAYPGRARQPTACEQPTVAWRESCCGRISNQEQLSPGCMYFRCHGSPVIGGTPAGKWT